MLLERYGLEVVMAFIKDMVRMWLHAWKRFISIALISLLGVAVLTGIYAGCRDAFLATDRFFDTQGLHDIQVLSTAGLTDDDIAALRKISGVAKVQGERSQTVTVDLNGKKTVTMQEIGTNGIDQPYLQSGRMPEKSGEIAVTRKFIKDSGYKKDDHITVTPQDSASSSVSDSAESDTEEDAESCGVTVIWSSFLYPESLMNLRVTAISPDFSGIRPLCRYGWSMPFVPISCMVTVFLPFRSTVTVCERSPCTFATPEILRSAAISSSVNPAVDNT